MTPEELNNIILNDFESKNLDFKAQFIGSDSKNRDVKTVCAFYNTEGGRIIFGVEENGRERKLNGLEPSPQTTELNISQKIRAKCKDIMPFPQIDLINLGGHYCVVVSCPRGENPPYEMEGKVYVRNGSSTVEATKEEIKQLYKRNSNVYDKNVIRESEISDLDLDAVRSFLSLRGAEQLIEEDLRPIMYRMGFIGDSVDMKTKKPTVAGLLLFGKRPQDFLPNAKIRAEAKFSKDSIGWDDVAEITGNIFDQIKSFEQFCKRNIKVSADIIGFERVEKPSLPIEALREGIVNAVTHRDYSDMGSEVHFRILGEDVSIDNPGNLIAPLTLDSIFSSTFIPKTRNPIVASCLTDAKLMDKRGTGILRIKKLMNDAGLSEPLFEELSSGFRLNFKSSSDRAKKDVKNRIIIPSDVIKRLNLETDHRKILRFVEDNKIIKTNDCLSLLNKSRQACIKKLKELVAFELLESTNVVKNDPSAGYRVHNRFSTDVVRLSTPEETKGQGNLFT